MNSKREKTTRLFSMILDDIIRSPQISSSEYRLYSVLLSYCDKTASTPICVVTKTLLAANMQLSVRGLTKLIRRLEYEALISVSYAGDEQKPVYTINISPPAAICPDIFKGRKLKEAVLFIRGQGGVREFQKRQVGPRGVTSRRIGWPEPKQKSSSPPLSQTDVESDVMSPTDSTHEPQFMGQSGKKGQTHEPQFMGSVVSNGQTHEPQFIPPMNSSSSSSRVRVELSLERPNGLKPEGRIRDLGFRIPSPDFEENARHEEEHHLRRAASNEEDDMGESSEQREVERARQRALRVGPRDKVSDLKTAEDTAKKRSERARSRSSETSSGRLTPGSLYTKFCAEVKSKYPGAILARHTDGRYMAWGKTLISNYSKDALDEMTKVLVLDYENFDKARKIFFKFAGTPHPTYEQFQGNAALLAGLVGVGVIAPPSVRYSAYADDYNKRHNKSVDNGSVVEGGGKTKVDPIQAIRDQVNR